MHFVYFVQPVDGGHIKIGITNDLDRRLSGLQTGSPVVLALRHFIEVDDVAQALALEQNLHRRYAALRQHGEWFDASPDLAKFAHATITKAARKHKATTQPDNQLRLDVDNEAAPTFGADVDWAEIEAWLAALPVEELSLGR